jgi:Lon protease-like protein
VVLLPEEILPLHIFEERYKQMIGECLEAKTQQPSRQEFGIVLVHDKEMQSVGCSARILRVVRKYPDGRLDILVMGKRRFEILHTNDEKTYLRCAVNFFDDSGPDTPAETDAARAISAFRQAEARLHQSSESPVQFLPPYRYLSFHIASALPLNVEIKQELLSVRQEDKRLAKVIDALNGLMERLHLSQRAQEKSRGNGNLPHRVN